MKLEEISWGIIGCGNVTELKSGPAFNKVPHSRLQAVMRRNGEMAADYALRHCVPIWYTDATQLIQDPTVNAIYIATPPDTHASYAIAAMRAGKPVYVEKPMARNYQECLEMLQVAADTGQSLHVAYYRRTLPAFLKVQELILEGSIGQPLTVNIRLHKAAGEKDGIPGQQSWHIQPEVSGGGYFFDLASHQLDYLDFLFGPITAVQGIATNQAGLYSAEDTVSAIFGFDSGISGTGSWCFVVGKDAEEDLLEITGTKGKLSLACFRHGDLLLTTADGTKSFSFQNPENISHNLIQQVVEELRGDGRCISTGISAARTSRIMDQITGSYYEALKKL